MSSFDILCMVNWFEFFSQVINIRYWTRQRLKNTLGLHQITCHSVLCLRHKDVSFGCNSVNMNNAMSPFEAKTMPHNYEGS